jgi:hypothetical protein
LDNILDIPAENNRRSLVVHDTLKDSTPSSASRPHVGAERRFPHHQLLGTL